MSEPERKSFLGSLPEALFIAALTAGAYWLSFRYEAGYLSAFGLPPHLVEVSLQTTLLVAFALSGAIWVVFWLVNFFLLLWPEHPAIQNKLFRVTVLLLFPLWYMLNYGLRVQDWPVYAIPLVLIAIFEFFWPLLVFSNKPTLRERFIADEITEAQVRDRGIAARILVAFGPAAYGLLVLFVLGGMLAHTAGRANAETQEEYFIFANAPDVAVVRVYNDRVIGVSFDRGTRDVQPQVTVQKIGTEKLILTLDVNVGPLKKQRPKAMTSRQESTSRPNKQMQPPTKGGS
jgi:hypothetical protein